MSAEESERVINLIDEARNELLDFNEERKSSYESMRMRVDKKLREAEFILTGGKRAA